MGIPSYYKKLTDTHPGLIQMGHPVETVQWLFMDFNCLIYHCIQQPDMPVYEGNDLEWQTELLERVVEYTEQVIQTVAPAKGVYLAIDGVVPMAKMRQQRLRRFKSQWLSERSSTVKWDTNAITPGTTFMETLHSALEGAAKRSSKKWIISTSNEVGEGEHKIIAEWRKETYQGNFAVYGLDADLIVLSLLTREVLHLENRVWLFREQMEKGACVYQDGKECFEWFCIHELRAWLSGMVAEEEKKTEWVMSYCAAMSILGNDFLPRSLGLTLRDDGHAKLLTQLRGLEGKSLVHTVSLELQPDVVFSLFKSLATEEEEHLQKSIQKRRRMAQIFGTSETGLGESNWPLVQRDEEILVERDGSFKTDWHHLYLTRFFPGFAYTSTNIRQLCEQYLHGIQWTWAYYTGQTERVCYDWYYPHSLPPLWSWLSAQTTLPSISGSVSIQAHEIDPQEQLGLVLPPKSWGLIRDPKIRQLRRLLPQYFPTDFGFESVGKRYFWECEAMIPVPSLSELKAILTSS